MAKYFRGINVLWSVTKTTITKNQVTTNMCQIKIKKKIIVIKIYVSNKMWKDKMIKL